MRFFRHHFPHRTATEFSHLSFRKKNTTQKVARILLHLRPVPNTSALFWLIYMSKIKSIRLSKHVSKNKLKLIECDRIYLLFNQTKFRIVIIIFRLILNQTAFCSVPIKYINIITIPIWLNFDPE